MSERAAGSRASVVTNSAIIVFREGLEAVLILAALMASMVGAQRGLRRPLLIGVGFALAGERRHVGRRPDPPRVARGVGEKLEAVVSLVAIAVLLLILNWFYHRVYWQENLQDLHKRKKRILAGACDRRPLRAGGRARRARLLERLPRGLRDRALPAGDDARGGRAGPSSRASPLGFAGVLAVFALVIALERRLPHKKMLVATGVLITASSSSSSARRCRRCRRSAGCR